MLIEFDPKLCSYEKLATTWSRMHSPFIKNKCQYRSAIWYINEQQKLIAETALNKIVLHRNDVHSKIEKATHFYRAEEYHQHFIQKQSLG